MNQTLLDAGTVLALLYTVTAVTLIAHWVRAARKPAQPRETRYGGVQIMLHGQPWTPKDNFLQGLRGSIRTKAEHYWDAAPGSTPMNKLNAYRAMAVQEQAQRDSERQISKKKHRKSNGKAKKRM